jgi:2-aminobenzoate-CoA ligase
MTAHVDTFVRDHLPAQREWPTLRFDLPELSYPAQLNCAVELLDRPARAHSSAIAIRTAQGDWTYGQLLATVNRLCRVLTEDLGMVPGNRVLLRSPNSPMLLASWLAVVKAGGVVVATMPMLRRRELEAIITKGQVTLALCDPALIEELAAVSNGDSPLQRIATSGGELEGLLQKHPTAFAAVATAQDDPCLLAFTSGTTGQPKATVHFHRDVLAMADTFARHLLKPRADDVFAGTPPLAFTFGLGAELVFPLRFGASTALLAGGKPEQIIEGLGQFGVTRLFTAPTAYRALLGAASAPAFENLRTCVSAGEHLPKATSDAWHAMTGTRIVDGIGATEMIHIFISAAGDDIRPGSTGKAVPGYRACVLGEDLEPVAPGTVGRLAVQGPTGCRYLADERQRHYVVRGWNLTGDAYRMDEHGYFWYEARTDDMIVSSGYNIAGPEVEAALLEHPDIAECAVIGVPDAQRGQIVKAVVVLRERRAVDAAYTQSLQRFVKGLIAPYKYPRAIEYVNELPRTATGKLQRFKLRATDRARDLLGEPP